MTEIEQLSVAIQGFNTNLVQFLSLCHIIISNMHVNIFMCMIYHMHRHEPNTVLSAFSLVLEKL